MKLAKLKMFSPFDSKLKVWMNPMFFMHAGQGERTWIEIVNDPNSLPGKHPQDFVLFQVGEFDDESGSVVSISPPIQLMSAVSAKRKPDGELPLGRVSN